MNQTVEPLQRRAKEERLRQRAQAIWLFGRPGAGKTTLAIGLERLLHEEGFAVHRLDGDTFRRRLSLGLGFSPADRTENLRRAAEASRVLVDAGLVAVSAFITPERGQRELVRSIVGAENTLLVHVSAPLDTCRERDPKGHYAEAARGGRRLFTGGDSGFETPVPGEAEEVDTERDAPADSLRRLAAMVRPRISLPSSR